MEMFIDTESGKPPAFSLTFEPEGISFSCHGDIVCIGFQACIQCCSHFWRNISPSLPPIIPTLHGLLCCPSDGHNNRGVGAGLVPSDELPIKFPKKDFPDDHKELLNLTFHCPSSYIQTELEYDKLLVILNTEALKVAQDKDASDRLERLRSKKIL
jgi:hypothetical protein